MTPKKRRILLATVASLIGVTAAIPMIVSGTASAQEGSRICGRKYHTTDPNAKITEVVFRIYDTPKHDLATCAAAQHGGGRTAFDSGFKFVNGSWDGAGVQIGTIFCEDFSKYQLGDFKILDDGTNPYDQFDICNNMKRSENVGDLNAYFLYKRSDEKVWHFKNG
jgi:hypothetical protein